VTLRDSSILLMKGDDDDASLQRQIFPSLCALRRMRSASGASGGAPIHSSVEREKKPGGRELAGRERSRTFYGFQALEHLGGAALHDHASSA